MATEGSPYDNTIKELFADSEDALINYFSDLKAEIIRDLNIEFHKIEEKKCDLITECQTEKGPVAIHLEFQSSNDKDIPFRMMRYALELHQKYKLPVYQILIYFGNWNLTMDNGLHYDFGPDTHLNYRYKIVDLGRISYEEIKASGNFYLYSLLPLIDRKRRKQKKEEFLKECAQEIVKVPLTLEEKRKTLLRAEIFAGLLFDKITIEQIFKEVESMLNIEESAGYQRIFEKGTEKGMEKGMEKGKQEATRENVLKLLNKKFKKLPSHYVEKVKGQDIYTLELIFDNIFEINKLEELDEYLE